MTRPLASYAACCLLAGPLLIGSAAASDPAPASLDPPDQLYRELKRFDFLEPDNYEPTPRDWYRLLGPGLTQGEGGFDRAAGSTAAPSLHLHITGGNAAYEYRGTDLPVIPNSDYLVTGAIRAVGMRNCRAFLLVYLVDRFGDLISGSERISPLVGSTGDDVEPWQPVRINISGEWPLAHQMRIQVWILQNYVWRDPDDDQIDPIYHQDIYADAWFDDIAIYRLPRARLRCSHPAGLIAPGTQESLLLEFDQVAARGVVAELDIRDSANQSVYRRRGDLLHDAATEHAGEAPSLFRTAADSGLPGTYQALLNQTAVLETQLPELPPGRYTAILRLLVNDDPVLERAVGLAVLPELPYAAARQNDCGVDLHLWQTADVAGTVSALQLLGVGAAKVGVPIFDPLEAERRLPYFSQFNELVRDLATARIETDGAILSPTFVSNLDEAQSTRAWISAEPNWREHLHGVLLHFAGLISTWQLGDDTVEVAADAYWEPTAITAVRRQLARFVSIPTLACPRSVLSDDPPPTPAAAEIDSVIVPAALATRDLPWQLSFLAADRTRRRWLTVASHDDPHIAAADELADLARRALMVKALNPDRLYAPVPLALSDAGGERAWHPTEAFLVWRTIFSMLSGQRGIGAMKLDDAVGLIFAGSGRSCVAAWSWRKGAPQPLRMYLGPDARAVDIYGRPYPVQHIGGQTEVSLTEQPVIIYDIDAALALLQASFEVNPAELEIHDPQPQALTFANHFDFPISGMVEIRPPEDWHVTPSGIQFTLEPGQAFTEPLRFSLPPRQVAARQQVGVRIELHSPEPEVLEFIVPLEVGLKDLAVDARAWWDGDTLIVEHAMRNQSTASVSFMSFCQPPAYPRMEQPFLQLAPGEMHVLTYAIAKASQLGGHPLHMGIEEIGGNRRLDQVVEIPPF